ncbi:uncharacterized protein LOC132705865 [Cylas formicarius]|uniref:uncharacterized protein LOC132705865 n=1 Tax=Cylas formicarius TaxID=197179 RepID=UPI0029585B6A|nr:uncharacterized protein LOC132705865 [Cylas formicarius]
MGFLDIFEKKDSIKHPRDRKKLKEKQIASNIDSQPRQSTGSAHAEIRKKSTRKPVTQRDPGNTRNENVTQRSRRGSIGIDRKQPKFLTRQSWIDTKPSRTRPSSAVSLQRGQNKDGQNHPDNLSRTSSVTNLDSLEVQQQQQQQGAVKLPKPKKSGSKERIDKASNDGKGRNDGRKGIHKINNNKLDPTPSVGVPPVDSSRQGNSNSSDSLQEIELHQLRRQLKDMADEKTSLALQLGEQRGQLNVLQKENLKLLARNSSTKMEKLAEENTALRNRLRDVTHSPLSDNEKQQLLYESHRHHSSAPASIATNLLDDNGGGASACTTPDWDKHSSGNISEVSVACLQDKINQMQETHYSTNEELQATLQELTDLQRQLTELQQENERLNEEKSLMFDSLCRQTERLNDSRQEVENLKQLIYRDRSEEMGVDHFESVAEREQKLVEMLQTTQEERETLLLKLGQIQTELHETRAVTVEKSDTIAQLTERVKTLECSLDAKNAEHKQLDQELTRAKDQCSGKLIEINRLSDLLENARTKINELEQDRALSDKSELDELLDNARKEKDQLESEVAYLKEQLARSKNEIDKLREQVMVLQEECKVTRNNAKTTRSDLEYKCEKLAHEKNSLVEQLQQFQEAINELQVQSQCHLEDKRQLSAVLSETQRNLSEAERRGLNLENEIDELKKLRSEENDEWEKFQNDLLTSVRVANDFKTEAQQELQKIILENKTYRERVRLLENQVEKFKCAYTTTACQTECILTPQLLSYAKNSEFPRPPDTMDKLFSVSGRERRGKVNSAGVKARKSKESVESESLFSRFAKRREKKPNPIGRRFMSVEEEMLLKSLDDWYANIDSAVPDERLSKEDRAVKRLKALYEDDSLRNKPVAKKPKEQLAISKPLLDSVVRDPTLGVIVRNPRVRSIEQTPRVSALEDSRIVATDSEIDGKPRRPRLKSEETVSKTEQHFHKSRSLDDLKLFEENALFRSAETENLADPADVQPYDSVSNARGSTGTLPKPKIDINFENLDEIIATIPKDASEMSEEQKFALKLKTALNDAERKTTLKKKRVTNVEISEPTRESVEKNRKLKAIMMDPRIPAASDKVRRHSTDAKHAQRIDGRKTTSASKSCEDISFSFVPNKIPCDEDLLYNETLNKKVGSKITIAGSDEEEKDPRILETREKYQKDLKVMLKTIRDEEQRKRALQPSYAISTEEIPYQNVTLDSVQSDTQKFLLEDASDVPNLQSQPDTDGDIRPPPKDQDEFRLVLGSGEAGFLDAANELVKLKNSVGFMEENVERDDGGIGNSFGSRHWTLYQATSTNTSAADIALQKGDQRGLDLASVYKNEVENNGERTRIVPNDFIRESNISFYVEDENNLAKRHAETSCNEDLLYNETLNKKVRIRDGERFCAEPQSLANLTITSGNGKRDVTESNMLNSLDGQQNNISMISGQSRNEIYCDSSEASEQTNETLPPFRSLEASYTLQLATSNLQRHSKENFSKQDDETMNELVKPENAVGFMEGSVERDNGGIGNSFGSRHKTLYDEVQLSVAENIKFPQATPTNIPAALGSPLNLDENDVENGKSGTIGTQSPEPTDRRKTPTTKSYEDITFSFVPNYSIHESDVSFYVEDENNLAKSTAETSCKEDLLHNETYNKKLNVRDEESFRVKPQSLGNFPIVSESHNEDVLKSNILSSLDGHHNSISIISKQSRDEIYSDASDPPNKTLSALRSLEASNSFQLATSNFQPRSNERFSEVDVDGSTFVVAQQNDDNNDAMNELVKSENTVQFMEASVEHDVGALMHDESAHSIAENINTPVDIAYTYEDIEKENQYGVVSPLDLRFVYKNVVTEIKKKFPSGESEVRQTDDEKLDGDFKRPGISQIDREMEEILEKYLHTRASLIVKTTGTYDPDNIKDIELKTREMSQKYIQEKDEGYSNVSVAVAAETAKDDKLMHLTDEELALIRSVQEDRYSRPLSDFNEEDLLLIDEISKRYPSSRNSVEYSSSSNASCVKDIALTDCADCPSAPSSSSIEAVTVDETNDSSMRSAREGKDHSDGRGKDEEKSLRSQDINEIRSDIDDTKSPLIGNKVNLPPQPEANVHVPASEEPVVAKVLPRSLIPRPTHREKFETKSLDDGLNYEPVYANAMPFSEKSAGGIRTSRDKTGKRPLPPPRRSFQSKRNDREILPKNVNIWHETVSVVKMTDADRNFSDEVRENAETTTEKGQIFRASVVFVKDDVKDISSDEASSSSGVTRSAESVAVRSKIERIDITRSNDEIEEVPRASSSANLSDINLFKMEESESGCDSYLELFKSREQKRFEDLKGRKSPKENVLVLARSEDDGNEETDDGPKIVNFVPLDDETHPYFTNDLVSTSSTLERERTYHVLNRAAMLSELDEQEHVSLEAGSRSSFSQAKKLFEALAEANKEEGISRRSSKRSIGRATKIEEGALSQIADEETW